MPGTFNRQLYLSLFLQIRNLRLREVRQLSQDHRAIKWQIWGSTSVFLFLSLVKPTQLQTRPVDSTVPCPWSPFLPSHARTAACLQPSTSLQVACTLLLFLLLEGWECFWHSTLLPVWFIFYLFELKLKTNKRAWPVSSRQLMKESLPELSQHLADTSPRQAARDLGRICKQLEAFHS